MEREISSDVQKSDEVTFLLRLRPTPPLRRKRCSDDIKPNVSLHTTTPKGWDVVIEQKEIDDKKPPLSPLRSRRLSHDYQNESCPRITYSSSNWDTDLVLCGENAYLPSHERGSRINYNSCEYRNSCELSRGAPPEIQPRTSSLEYKEINSSRKVSLLKDIFYSPKLPRRRNSIDNRLFPSCFGNNCDESDVVWGKSKCKSPSPPPLPPRFRPSAPPQELADSIIWHPKPYYPIFQPIFATSNEQIVYNTTNHVIPSSYNNINNSVSNFVQPSMFKENVNFQTPGHNFNTTVQNIRNSGTDLISSYSVVQPLSAPGFHVNTNTPPPPMPPSPFPLRPPKPLPRLSVINKTVNSHESNRMIRSHSELALHLLVSILYFFLCKVLLLFRIFLLHKKN